MNRGVDRQAIFFADDDRREFGSGLGVLWAEHGIEIHAYCLMDNHFHLLLRCPRGNLSDALQHVMSRFVRTINHRGGRDGPLVRGRFRSRLITTPGHQFHALRYIHRNPLDVVGVRSVDQYRWSSHRTYLGLRPTPDWLFTAEGLRWFGNDRSAFDAYVQEAQRSCPRPLTGDDSLLGTIELVVAERSHSRPGARRAEATAIALHLVDEFDADRRRTVLDRLAIPNRKALSNARSRGRKLIAGSPELEAMIDAVRNLHAA